MEWKLSGNDDLPIFRQIAQYYERQILAGSMPPGTRLPPERRLARQLAVNRSTVTTAYEELRASGLVSSVRGSGTVVSELLWEEDRPIPKWRRPSQAGASFDPSAYYYGRIGQERALSHAINLTQGELSPDLMPLQELRRLAGEADCASPYSYWCDWRGDESLRESLAAGLRRQHGIATAPERLVITAGVKHALHLIAATLLQPGDAVAVEGPSYLYAMHVFPPAGIRMVKLPSDGRGAIPERIPELVSKHRIKMVFVNPTYQNPTGTTMPPSRRRRLLEVCAEHRLPIVEDDPYGQLWLDPSSPPPPPIRALPGAESSVLYLGTMSKTVTPGMRIGWIAAPAPIAARLAEAKFRMGYTTAHPGERLARQWLVSGEAERHLASVRSVLASRRAAMIAALAEQAADVVDALTPHASPGGFYVWLRLRRPSADRALFDACAQAGVLVLPGAVYGAEKGHMRLTYASADERQIQEGVARLGAALRQW